MRLNVIALSGIAVLGFPLAAHADPQGWYLGFGAGWTTLGSLGYGLAPPAGPQAGKVDFGDNAAVDLTAGYRFEMPLRLETELNFADYQATLLRPSGLAPSRLNGDVSNVSFFTNAIYDVPLSRNFALSLGFGLGFTQVDPSISDPLGHSIHDSQAVFSWHLLAGFTMALSDRLELEADYRYQQADSTDHRFFAAQTSPFRLNSKNTQSVMLSLRWYVAPPAPPPPPIPPPPPPPPLSAPPPPPPAPAPVKTFIVFFDFDKSDLNDRAFETVAQAVESAKQTGAVKVLVTGHTDTTGSAAYNLALSERRATAVKIQMVKDGLSDSDITTTGKGFDDPLVATGPGVREPQNRRAVIDFGN